MKNIMIIVLISGLMMSSDIYSADKTAAASALTTRQQLDKIIGLGIAGGLPIKLVTKYNENADKASEEVLKKILRNTLEAEQETEKMHSDCDKLISLPLPRIPKELMDTSKASFVLSQLGVLR